MGKKTNPRSLQGARGGRPRKDGDRYPNGRLKPAGPAARTLEIRQSLGLEKMNQKMIPLDVAHARGWLSDADFLTGIRFASLHQAAGFTKTGGSAGSSHEVETPTEVSLSVTLHAKSFFSSLPHAEIVALWDQVFARSEPDTAKAEDGSAKAMRKWKAANAAMTMQERAEVTDVCVHDSWPQWIIQRTAGRMDTSWERKRDLLVSGLGKVRTAIGSPKPANHAQPSATVAANDAARPTGPVRTERTLLVDQDTGEVFRVIERITRRAA